MKKTFLNIAAILVVTSISFIACKDPKQSTNNTPETADTLAIDSTKQDSMVLPEPKKNIEQAENSVKTGEDTGNKENAPAETK